MKLLEDCEIIYQYESGKFEWDYSQLTGTNTGFRRQLTFDVLFLDGTNFSRTSIMFNVKLDGIDVKFLNKILTDF